MDEMPLAGGNVHDAAARGRGAPQADGDGLYAALNGRGPAVGGALRGRPQGAGRPLPHPEPQRRAGLPLIHLQLLRNDSAVVDIGMALPRCAPRSKTRRFMPCMKTLELQSAQLRWNKDG
eukprot:scaffold281639_cov27-Prasinocladus_malaysianus.AAC.2